ncbi:MAG: PAS domain-containing sensor histidine kinase [Deltaproteobacteria bacterium HGW-Deltaproteobacteria-13]|jgi:PAS domain S-box-containing protein|nr:MAG: PAS domain-containing sensor histidine kinase [Deltaproteobacteria bacterium HGW-Deltaproteobacteria-13]
MDTFVERRKANRRTHERRGTDDKPEDTKSESERRQSDRRRFERRESERKKMEEAMREHAQKRRVILEDIEEAYYEADINGRFVFVNNAMCNILGYAREELIGQKYWYLLDKPTAKTLYAAMDKSCKTNETVNLLDMEAIHKDGKKLISETSVSIVRDTEGTIIGFRGISRDVTKRRQMEAALKKNQEELIRKNKEIDENRKHIQHALEKLEKTHEELKTSQLKILQQEKMASIGQLAAGVAHELNNPMSFISSNLGTLDKYVRRLIGFIETQSEVIKSFKDASAARKINEKRKALKLDYVINDVNGMIRESLDGSERVKRIVKELNSFSRMDEEEYKEADINECIESAITIVWNELKYKSTLEKNYGKLPLTKCYAGQINQIFVNLLINAVNSITERGIITIKTWYQDGSIWMEVSDTGCGIPKENLVKIFEPFFTTKEVGKGTGLGLSITYEIVQRHKGEITVKSEVGKGTSFTVRIPVV